ncbi:dihydroxy-acid dehydratase [Nibricoccus sp. IMCC34717]|uniref:dihydroxy-acid dehydratase n=1 Tax=Nibricoccus sp. IMCC34717 TaxID=3034021 RepID=UPI003850EC4B
MAPLRSSQWFERADEIGLQNRAVLRQLGIVPKAVQGQPIIGIANTWSDFNPCNLSLRNLVEDVKAGVIEAGGVPLEFHCLSLGEELMKPSAMLYRNLLAMEVEEAIRGYPMDGIVCLGGCDKTLPAELMACASADLPSIFLNSGPKTTFVFEGEQIGSGTALWKFADAHRIQKLDTESLSALEHAYAGTVGTCNVMGTASTMAAVLEGLGLMIPGAAFVSSTNPRRAELARETGRLIVSLTQRENSISQFLTPDALHNALHLFTALGGSTNCILHLMAAARRRRLPLDLIDFDTASRKTPVLADIQPTGLHLIDALEQAGGVPAVMHAIQESLRLDTPLVTGSTWRKELKAPKNRAIRPLDNPVRPCPGLAVLRGSLAPSGAILRLSTAGPIPPFRKGRAVVFEDYDDMLARIDSPSLEVTAESVLILRQAGPKGVPGMPEWGNIPIPRKLLEQGVSDILRISDSRMSGTASGSVVLHVTPEAAEGGPLALVQNGDWISLDIENRELNLLVDSEVLEIRRKTWRPKPGQHARGWPRLYQEHVNGADQGCDFDFLVPNSEADQSFKWPVVGRS